MAFVGPGPAAEAAADSLANTQAMLGFGSLAETGQISAAGATGAISNLLLSQAIARNALFSLGLFGPYVGATPGDLAANVQFSGLVNGLVGSLAGMYAAQSYLGLGTAALLANSGRRFLNSTYFGI